ncbi:MAG: hypothetical protein R8K50_06145 [Mariprofundus sp.]
MSNVDARVIHDLLTADFSILFMHALPRHSRKQRFTMKPMKNMKKKAGA